MRETVEEFTEYYENKVVHRTYNNYGHAEVVMRAVDVTDEDILIEFRKLLYIFNITQDVKIDVEKAREILLDKSFIKNMRIDDGVLIIEKEEI